MVDASVTTENVVAPPTALEKKQRKMIARKNRKPRKMSEDQKKVMSDRATAQWAKRRAEKEDAQEVLDTAAKTIGQGALSREDLLDAIRILKEPDPEMKAEKEAENLRRAIAKANEQNIILEAERLILANQEMCERTGHKQNGGQSTASAVVSFRRGEMRICVGCNKVWDMKAIQEAQPA
jgi:hypothetical protein